jgi:hypothetical protein
MLTVLLLVLTVVFPLLLYFALKAVAWLDFRKRVLPRLAAELDAATAEFEGYVHEHVAPRDPRRGEEMLRESAVRRRAFAEASQVSGAAYLLRRPGLERSLEELVRAASTLPKDEGPAAAEGLASTGPLSSADARGGVAPAAAGAPVGEATPEVLHEAAGETRDEATPEAGEEPRLTSTG